MPSTSSLRRLRPPPAALRAYAGILPLSHMPSVVIRAPFSPLHLRASIWLLSSASSYSSKLPSARTFSSSRSSCVKNSYNVPKSSDRTFDRAALNKPAKGATPSHPTSTARSGPIGVRRGGKTYTYGGELSAAQRAAQKTKQYPHMMPPEGTRMHWFLTSRLLHLGISIGVLSFLAFLVFILEFRRKTPYLDLLPSWSDFFLHPFATSHQVWTVYNQHVSWTTAQTQLKRDKDVEDARKRKAYRVAHGLEEKEHGLQGGVPGVDVEYGEMVGGRRSGQRGAGNGDGEAAPVVLTAAEQANLDEEAAFERKVKQAYRESIANAGGDPKIMDEWNASKSRPRELKKWFGIW